MRKCRASLRPFCFCNAVDSRSRHAPFHYLCDEKPNAPCWSSCVCETTYLCHLSWCLEYVFIFFSFAFPPQGDFAVVGHVEEKNDRQVDPPHKSTLILIHVNATAYWSLFMCNLKDKSRFVAFIIKKGRQLNVQKPKMKATLIMPNNAVFIFLASSPPPRPICPAPPQIAL